MSKLNALRPLSGQGAEIPIGSLNRLDAPATEVEPAKETLDPTINANKNEIEIGNENENENENEQNG